MRWQRRFFDIIMLWEGVVRGVFVQLPTKLFELIDGFEKVVSFFFVYVMLQALAILWGFLFNVGAILGDNMINILQMPFSQALCVLLTHASVIGIVLSFGRATWILTWQSTQNFPLIRRVIAYECRPQSVINIVAMPMLVLLPSLILVPSVCAQTVQEDATSSWAKTICEESYLKFLTDKHPVFQRALRLSTAIAIWQFIQACLEILPRWPLALKGLSTSWTFILGGSLVLLNVVGAVWGVEWAARHIQYDATPLSTMTPMQWEIFGMTLLTAWIVWFLLLTWRTSTNVTTCSA
ncbi:hypothetical protein PINS_up005178 [Pythium insidiosum]|nr:hypothetical protein PINS_up005178 [Pythium insidiosum]